MTTSDLNRVIDDMARRMTAGPETPDVRTRVLDRLNDRHPWHWRLALVPAAIALAMAAVILVRISGRPVVIATDSRRASQTVDQAGELGQSVSRETPPAGITPRPADVAGLRRVGATAPSSELQALVIPALDTPDAVTLVSIQPEALEIRPLDTAPLLIPPLDDDTNRP